MVVAAGWLAQRGVAWLVRQGVAWLVRQGEACLARLAVACQCPVPPRRIWGAPLVAEYR